MGYTTNFAGHIALSRKLTIAEAKQLLEFNEEPNSIPGDHPSSYMQWVPSETLDAIVWDQEEKFYNYTEWLVWLMGWMQSIGVVANGTLAWSGEEVGDVGQIIVAENAVTALPGKSTKSAHHKPMNLDKLARMALDAATK